MDRKVLAAMAGIIGLAVVMLVFRPVSVPDVSEVPDELFCTSDSDCVEEQICHPTSCINSGFKEESEPVFCTAECAPGTMDCGQGYCACINNQCKVVFNE